MIKRAATPLSKDRLTTRNNSNASKPLRDTRDTRNIQSRANLSRNSSNSKLLIVGASTEPMRYNPQSADRRRNNNRQISNEMRKLIVQWMLQVSHRSKMRRQTVFMAVKIFDVALDNLNDITTINVQLLATCCLFMSAKYQEIYPESLNKFLDYTLNSYQRTEMLMMENKILTLMNFKLTFDTRYTHAGMIIEKELSYGSTARKFKSLVCFLLQISLLNQWEQYTEQQLGEAAVFLATKVLKYPPNSISEKVMEGAYRLLNLWRENQGGVLAYLFDSEAEYYVGGLKVVY